VAAEPGAADEVAIVAYDAVGNRVGPPITRRVA
jgi:hypothetical protein